MAVRDTEVARRSVTGAITVGARVRTVTGADVPETDIEVMNPEVHLLTLEGGDSVSIEIGIGIATGPLIAGAFGGHDRLGYSVHGEAVALAQRIQALSHQYGPSVIVSGATAAAADRSFAFLEVDTVAAGKQDPPVTLFALCVLGWAGSRQNFSRQRAVDALIARA